MELGSEDGLTFMCYGVVFESADGDENGFAIHGCTENSFADVVKALCSNKLPSVSTTCTVCDDPPEDGKACNAGEIPVPVHERVKYDGTGLGCEECAFNNLTLAYGRYCDDPKPCNSVADMTDIQKQFRDFKERLDYVVEALTKLTGNNLQARQSGGETEFSCYKLVREEFIEGVILITSFRGCTADTVKTMFEKQACKNDNVTCDFCKEKLSGGKSCNAGIGSPVTVTTTAKTTTTTAKTAVSNTVDSKNDTPLNHYQSLNVVFISTICLLGFFWIQSALTTSWQ